MSLPTVVIVDDEQPDVVVVPPLPADLVTTVPISIKGDKGDKGDSADAVQLVADHVASPLPHPAYDDMADLTLLFENGLI